MAKEQDLIIKIKADTDKAEKEVGQLTKQVDKLTTSAKKSSKQNIVSEGVNKGFGDLRSTLVGVVAGFGALGVAVKAVEFGKLASQAEQSADAFEKVFTDMGLNAEEEFQKIKDASYGLIPDQAIKQSATTAVSLGVPLDKLAQLMEVARAKAREMGTDAQSAFNDLAIGIGRGSPMILDNLGLTIKLEQANQDYAKTLGITVAEMTKSQKAMALTNAVIDAGADSITRFKDAGLSSQEQFQALNATMENLKVEIGNGLLKVMVQLAKDTNEWIKSLDPSTLDSVGDSVGGIAKGLLGIFKTIGLLNDVALPDWLFGDGAKFFTKVAEGWDIIFRTMDGAVDEFDAVFKSMDQAEAQAVKVDSLARAVKNFAGGSIELKGLKEQLEATYEANEKLLDKWSNSEVSNLYKQELKLIYEEQHKIEESLHQISIKENVYKKQQEGAKALADEQASLTKAIADYSEENIRDTGEFYKERLATAKTTLSSLKKEEASLTKTIADAHKTLAKELKRIDDERFASSLSITDKIRQIEQEVLTTKELFIDKQLEAEQKLALAKTALNNNQLKEYRTYIQQYEALALENAQSEIKGDNLVKRSAQEVRTEKLKVINEVATLQNQYFQTQTANAKTAHDLTVAQAQAELNGTKATIEALKVMIGLMADFVKATTGKKLTLDTTQLDSAVAKMEASNTLVDSLNRRRTIISVDSAQIVAGNEKIKELKRLTLNGATLTIKPNTDPTEFGIKKFINEFDTEGNLINVKVNPLWQEAKTKIENEFKEVEDQPIDKEVKPNTKEWDNLDKELEDAIADVDAEVVITANDDDVEDAKGRAEQPTNSMHDIDVDNRQTEQADAQNKINTKSYHTIIVKEIPARSGGGAIPQRLAGGGTFRGSGRVQGYDPSDSDGVNAYLTGGEFVVKRKAVDAYGLAFLNAINNMNLSKPKGYAEGGLVGSSGGTQALRPIQLNIGGGSFPMMADKGVSDALQRFINNEGGM